MTIIEFLQAELKNNEDGLRKIAVNFNGIVKEVVANSGADEHEVIVNVEAIKRALKTKCDVLKELIKKAEQIA